MVKVGLDQSTAILTLLTLAGATWSNTFSSQSVQFRTDNFHIKIKTKLGVKCWR